jgi:hypothetical protein
MPPSGMLRCVALVRMDVSEEPTASIIRVTRIGELDITLAVTSNRRTQKDPYNRIPRLIVHKQIIPTEWPPLVGEISARIYG